MNEPKPAAHAPSAEEASRPADLLESIAAEAPPGEDHQRMALRSGRVVEARAEPGGQDRVTIRGATGEVELEVRMTEHGPVLRFKAAGLELDSTGDMKVRCDNFDLKAKGSITQESGGPLKQKIGADADIRVRGEQSTKAGEIKIASKRGNVEIEANDDVQIVGERVKLNC